MFQCCKACFLQHHCWTQDVVHKSDEMFLVLGIELLSFNRVSTLQVGTLPITAQANQEVCWRELVVCTALAFPFVAGRLP